MAKKTPRSREEARAMMNKRQKKIDNPDENRLQFSIVKAYYDKYPENENTLIGYDANGLDGQEGGMKLSMGVRKNVSDLMWFDENGNCYAIELKTDHSYHELEHIKGQARYILKTVKRGCFCISEAMFWDYIEGDGKGIPAQYVLDYLERTGDKSVHFGKIYKDYLLSLK